MADFQLTASNTWVYTQGGARGQNKGKYFSFSFIESFAFEQQVLFHRTFIT